FGYFENEVDNLRTMNAIKADLNPYGFGVIDFMNIDFVINNLVSEDIKTVQGIDFKQKRYVKDGYLFKDISFKDKGENFHFQERVKAFTLKDFEDLFERAGIYLLDIFGDYKLNKFHKNTSERLIMVFK
ncbi:MAG: SAM-dependent methyltransferase, partial [Xanthomarina sp.]